MRKFIKSILIYPSFILIIGCQSFFADEKKERPEIRIVDDGGNIYPDAVAVYDFGTLTVGQESAPVNFTIQNIGKADLVLTENPAVSLTGFMRNEYKIISQPSSVIRKGTSSPFTIVFAPLGGGIREAGISIPNNDSTDGENPVVFGFTGNGSPIVSTVKTSPYVEGSVTLSGGAGSSKVKIGLFFGSGTVQSGNEKYAFDSLKGRLYYLNNAAKGSLYKFTPAVLGSYTGGSYFINFPDITKITTSDIYYLVAWYDSDDDGVLTLYAEGTQSNLDQPVLNYAHVSEYNRMPVITVTDPSASPPITSTPVWASYFEQEKLTSVYEFKYYGVSNPSSVYSTMSLTESGSSNFNFTISNTVDSN